MLLQVRTGAPRPPTQQTARLTAGGRSTEEKAVRVKTTQSVRQGRTFCARLTCTLKTQSARTGRAWHSRGLPGAHRACLARAGRPWRAGRPVNRAPR